jgi:hypothetical protein
MTTQTKKEKLEKKYNLLPLNNVGEIVKNNFRIISPRNLVIVKYPKSGSTLSIGDVPKILIADSEQGTRNFPISNKVNLLKNIDEEKFVKTSRYGYIPQSIFDLVNELDEANDMKTFAKLEKEFDNCGIFEKESKYKEIIKHVNKMPFPILAIDTITSLIDISNKAALYEYNSTKDPNKQKANIKKADSYGGVMYIRTKFNDIKRFIENHAAPFIQYHGHVASKKKVLKKTQEEIDAIDIALDGLLSTIFTSKADSVCTFYRNDDGCFMDFTKPEEETALGTRCLHLSNKIIKIADIQNNENLEAGTMPVTYWGEVYPEIEALKIINNK